MNRHYHTMLKGLLLAGALTGLSLTFAQTLLVGKGRFVDNDPVTIRVWLNDAHVASEPSIVVLQVPAINAGPLKTDTSQVTLLEPEGVLTRLIDETASKGIAHAMLDLPSDARTLPMPASWRENPSHHQDINTGIELIRKRFPGVKVYLAALNNNATSLISYADRATNKSDGLLLVSPNLFVARAYKLSATPRTLIVSVPTARCYINSHVDVQELVERTGWTVLPVYYPTWGNRDICGNNSQAGLTRRFKDVGIEVANWLRHAPHASALGDNTAGIAGDEQIMMLKGSKGLVEVTVYKPKGAGPFPTMIWNHGDIDADSLHRKGVRYREPMMAHEFVDMGIAVAVVSRPGIGRSEGHYATWFNPRDADAIYKGRTHAQELLAVWPQLQQLPWVDKTQLILAGQSAGGYATVAAVGLKIPELKAALTFSGGHTDMTSTSPPSHRNDVMIRGFEVSGQQANAPLMMVFAENDSRYTANTIRESHKAFEAAGGKATLALYPALKRDGHFLYHEPQIWREDVRKFLKDAGIAVTDRKP